MYNNKEIELKDYYTISEACEQLGLDTDKLRYLCVLEGIIPFRVDDGILGIGSYDIRRIERVLDEQEYKRNLPRSDGPWD